MERRHRTVLTLFQGRHLEPGALRLDADAGHHAHVRRARPGEAIRIVNGRGLVATGEVTDVARAAVDVLVTEVVSVQRPSPLELLVPVADRDRMLLAAEKAVELQATGWHPVLYARSRSVTGRGEGARFHEKVAARMRSALEQSGGAWLPELHDEVDSGTASGLCRDVGQRFVLEADGAPFAAAMPVAGVAIAAGPEGGFEPAELERAVADGWSKASIGGATLRFETALIAAAAVVRAHQTT